MAVLNDYECVEHGLFEGRGPHCPECGKAGKLVHLQAPAVGRKTAQFVDGMVNRLMGEFGISDVPKQSDARETTHDVKRVRSTKDQPLPQPAQKMNIDVQRNLASLTEASRAGNDVMQTFRRGRGTVKPPISLAITDKR